MATAITAGIREMLDAGMLANFPGFIYLQTAGGKQMTNNFRVPAGGGAAFQGNSQQKLQDQIMALPYKEAGPAMQQLVASLREVGQRVGRTAGSPPRTQTPSCTGCSDTMQLRPSDRTSAPPTQLRSRHRLFQRH
jgi:hypothetical protein